MPVAAPIPVMCKLIFQYLVMRLEIPNITKDELYIEVNTGDINKISLKNLDPINILRNTNRRGINLSCLVFICNDSIFLNLSKIKIKAPGKIIETANIIVSKEKAWSEKISRK